MIIKKTFKFCLRPNGNQRGLFAQFAGARRWVYNNGLAQRKKLWEEEKKSISLFDQNDELVDLKKAEKTGWLKEIHSQILQQSLDDLDKAFKHFFRRVKNKETPGYPRFKCKGEHDSFRYPQGAKIKEDRVFLPKIGWVRFRKSREIQGKLKQVTVVKDGTKWYVCFSCEITQDIQSIPATDVAGIDMGLERFATIATETEISQVCNPTFLRKDLSRFRYLCRRLSKKTFKSKNWRKAKARLQAWHAKIRHRRQDFLHKLSTLLVKNHDAIAVESLNVTKLLMKSKKALARAISDAGWRGFLQMLEYKCTYQGKKFVTTYKFFPSTQLCSRCHAKQHLELHERTYRCECGLTMHRDHNAACNIRAAGMSVLKACGAVS